MPPQLFGAAVLLFLYIVIDSLFCHVDIFLELIKAYVVAVMLNGCYCCCS